MKILSINIGLPREVPFNGQTVTTGIFKQPVDRRVYLRKLNLEGDKQADLTVHGGLEKAVYAYPGEHYEYWREELPDMSIPYGMFGENFTTRGLLEEQINIGDSFEIGAARLMVTQPRMPCYKLGIKFGRMDIVRQFLASGRPGIYFKVLREGEVGVEDEIKLIKREKNSVTVKDIARIYVDDKKDIETMKRAIMVKALAKGFREHFRQQIEKIGK